MPNSEIWNHTRCLLLVSDKENTSAAAQLGPAGRPVREKHVLVELLHSKRDGCLCKCQSDSRVGLGVVIEGPSSFFLLSNSSLLQRVLYGVAGPDFSQRFYGLRDAGRRVWCQACVLLSLVVIIKTSRTTPLAVDKVMRGAVGRTEFQ